MKHIKTAFMSLALAFVGPLMAQQTPAGIQTEAISIQGATAHIGNGSVIENATLVFENGMITAVGGADTPTKGNVIDASGGHVYPGFIANCTSLGLVEIDAVRATDDQDEIGDMIPHIRSLIAYNAESKVVESMRPNGILLAQVSPKGGFVSGTSSVMQLDAWNWEDAVVKTDDAIHVNWPSSFRRGRWWMGEDPGLKPNANYQRDIAAFKTFMENAKVYKPALARQQNRPFEATQGLFDGSQKLFVTANGEKEIIDAVTTAKQLGVKEVVLVGGSQAYKVTDFLKKHQIAVLVEATHQLPSSDDADYDQPYKLPKLLSDAGILVSIQNADAANFQNRNLPFYAGQVVGQGMDKEAALSMITLNAAKILGIDKEFGSLEVGKSATLFISQGDALDMRTNQLSAAFIQGRAISLETHQTELWKRYMGKFEGK
ncbi:MAG: amidohydrolase family protein [Flavobacteriia bacterium]|nr:amidohydrolase family protein [Flavobacteriia bacterium]